MRGWFAVALLLAGCGKKNVPEAPLVGWQQESEEWAAACFYPQNWDELGPGDRRLARQDALEQMKSQWTGGRDDGVSFDDQLVYELETVLLGEPEHIEELSVTNLAFCKKYMAGEGTSGWQRYLAGLPAKLTEGECPYRPFIGYELHDYLDIQRDWQIPVQVCEGNQIRVSGSTIDKYRISEDSAWIDVTGHADQPTIGGEWPCDLEGCLAGQLVMRFTGDSGVELVQPVGRETVFTAPEHGRLEVSINDTTWFDNVFRIQSGIEDHTSIEYSPVE